MGATKKIPSAEWEKYFDRFTQEHLRGGGESDARSEAAIEVLSPSLGDQLEATLVPVTGLTYDPKSNSLELSLENLDHLVYLPAEIWVIEEDDGFISSLEVARDDGTKEIIYLRQSGAPASVGETSSPPPQA